MHLWRAIAVLLNNNDDDEQLMRCGAAIATLAAFSVPVTELFASSGDIVSIAIVWSTNDGGCVQ